MLTRIFPCMRSSQLVNDRPVRRNNTGITIGRDGKDYCSAYLYVPLTDFSSDVLVSGAQLVLFVMNQSFDNADWACIRITPTNQYINPYGGLEWSQNKKYLKYCEMNIPLCQSVITLDITELVVNWANLSLCNNGFVIEMVNGRGCLMFAGSQDNMAPPFLNVYYSLTCEIPPVYSQPCVELAASAVLKGV